jgi:hypothetical protein
MSVLGAAVPNSFSLVFCNKNALTVIGSFVKALGLF